MEDGKAAVPATARRSDGQTAKRPAMHGRSREVGLAEGASVRTYPTARSPPRSALQQPERAPPPAAAVDTDTMQAVQPHRLKGGRLAPPPRRGFLAATDG